MSGIWIMQRLAERGWEFFMGLAPGNVSVARLLKLISKCSGKIVPGISARC